MPLVPGAQFGPYRIVSQLGQGGMATVYKAFQPSLGRHVALKVLPEFFADQPGFKQRFQQEAMAVARLRHSNIPVVFDYGEESGAAYIVSEYLGGGDLTTKIGSAPVPISEAVAWLLPVASALDYAHSQAVLHRDLKPSNILLSDNGTPFLSDFGLAKMMGGESERLTATGMVLGTPEYMSPEQCLGGEITGAADLYSLGVIAFEMLTSRVPFSAPTPAAVIVAQLQAPLPLPTSLNPELPLEVEGVLLKGLAKDPNDRYPSASEFVAALAAGDRTVPVAQETISSPPASVERAAVAVADATPAAPVRIEPPPPPSPASPPFGGPSRRRGERTPITESRPGHEAAGTSRWAAGFYPDPLQRHRERFWSGAEWTSRVRNRGVEDFDRIPGAITTEQASSHRAEWLVIVGVLVFIGVLVWAAVYATTNGHGTP